VSVPVAVVVTTFLTIVAIVVAVLFAKARQAEWEHREWTEVPAGSNVTPPVPPQIVEIQTTSQPPPVPAPHPAPHPVPHPAPHPEPQAEWTEECSAALEALIALRIPKKRSIDLVRRAAGSTRDEILRAALRIHGQSRTQPITGNVNGHANGANTPTQVAPASQSMQQQSQREGAIAALISLGIPNQTATALIQQMPATPQKNYFEMRFEFCASVNNSDE
jgi:hypothetical protein